MACCLWRLRSILKLMRSLQRDALVAYILNQMQAHPASAHIDTPDKLFEYFLIDVQMDPCMQTSRIRHALSSVQSLRRMLLLLGNSVAQWSLMGVCLWMSVAAVGVDIGPALTVIALAATVVAVTLPNAPGYLGALQAAFVFSLQPFGVSSETGS